MRHDPRIPEQFSEDVQRALSKHQRFEYMGGLLTLSEVRRGREPSGVVSYVAVFEVLEEEPGREWLVGPVYCESEYLVACSIADGVMQPTDREPCSGGAGGLREPRQSKLSEGFGSADTPSL
jgi:hypothetical protein